MITTPDIPIRYGGAELMRRRALVYLDELHGRLLALEALQTTDAGLELLGEALFTHKSIYEIVLLGVEYGGSDLREVV